MYKRTDGGIVLHVEFLVEEQSMKEALNVLLPKILEDTTFKIHDFRGKQEMLKKLPERLKGYKAWIPQDYKIVVLLDEDRQDCKKLKEQLERIAQDCGFVTKASAHSQSFQVLNRIAIEELEAWFLGDFNAVVSAYPKIPKTTINKSKYRDPDAITGGTWEALEKILQKYRYHSGGLRKVEAAKEIARHMNPEQNVSKSFQFFYRGLLQLCDRSKP